MRQVADATSHSRHPHRFGVLQYTVIDSSEHPIIIGELDML